VTDDAIDSYRWLPHSMAAYYREMDLPRQEPIPFAKFAKPLREAKIAAITTGGVHLKDDRPFDIHREQREPAWGDPSFRLLPQDIDTGQVSISHLHYNHEDALADLDVLLPLPLLRRFAAEGEIGGLTPRHYSFMGFQLNPKELLDNYLPDVVETLREDGADAVVLTPA
jgi:D-proline reductase (dithiol) PrdB